MGKSLVTDGQLGQLAVRQHDFFERVKRGAYADFDQVMAAFQAVIEGRVPEAPVLHVKPKRTKWRSFLIGGVNHKTLLARVAANSKVSDWAKDIMKQKAFTTQETEENIDTIILTPADFGYEKMPTTTELFDPDRLLRWSMQNAAHLPEGCVVELLPVESGPHIRDQYKDQSKGEYLWIAMERITDSRGYPSVFCVERRDSREQWLNASWARPGNQWGFDARFVFRLRKV